MARSTSPAAPLMRWKRNPAAFIRSIQRAERNALRELKTETGRLARVLESNLKQRVKPAKQVSRQDDFSVTSAQSRPLPKIYPFRVTATDGETKKTIAIEITAHFIGARSKAVQGVMKYLGKDRQLDRAGIYVINNKKRGKRARDGGVAKFTFFAENPRLKLWADRANKGNQAKRHVIKATAAILEYLLMGPLLRKKAKQIKAAWQSAFKRGFKP